MKNKQYTDEFKLEVVNDYLNSELGCRAIAKKYNLSSKNYIERWQKQLIEKGLIDKNIKPKTKKATHNKLINSKTEYEKKLEKENLELKAKLAYYKELEKLGVDIHKKK